MKRYLFLTVTLVLFFSLAVNAFAATYYVKTDGNDNLDGRSDAKAWKTIGKVNSYNFATGDDVYFKCGGTWTGGYLIVDWTGISSNRITIGAYYIDGGTETIGVSGNKPVINGNNSIPSDLNNGLVHVNYRDFVTVENLRLINSFGCGVKFHDSDNGIAMNVDVDYIRASGIMFYKSNNGLAENCTAHNVGTGWKYYGDSDWGYGIGGTQRCDNIVVRSCKVYECWTEGIGFYKASDNCIAENNTVYATQKAGIYIDAGQGCIIRHNLVYGTTESSFRRSSGFMGAALWVADEGRVEYRSENNQFYGNLVAYCYNGMRVGCDKKAFTDSAVLNNTFVDCFSAITFYGDQFSNSLVKNNIFWQPSGGTMFRVEYGSTSQPGLTWSNNCWYPSSGKSGPGDKVANPLLSKTSGWQTMKGGDLKGSDFALQPNSPAQDAGTPLGREFVHIPECDKSVWPAQIVLMDQDNQGSGWEIGADIYVENPTALDPPTNLKIAAGQ